MRVCEASVTAMCYGDLHYVDTSIVKEHSLLAPLNPRPLYGMCLYFSLQGSHLQYSE